jgi:hypothetical protein
VLDVRPFTVAGAMKHARDSAAGPGTGAGAGAGAGGVDDGDDSARPSTSLYDLMSVVVHLGGPYSGHYITYRRVPVPVSAALGGAASASATASASASASESAFVLDSELPRLWAECSDSTVHGVAAEDVVRDARAYMLFYVRRDVGVDPASALVAASREVVKEGEWLRSAPLAAAAGTDNAGKQQSTSAAASCVCWYPRGGGDGR